MNIISLTEDEYSQLTQAGKRKFEEFCSEFGLKLPASETPEGCRHEFKLFNEALYLFNIWSKRNRIIYTINDKLVCFTYSSSGLDLEYQVYDPETVLKCYFEEKQKLKKAGEKLKFCQELLIFLAVIATAILILLFTDSDTIATLAFIGCIFVAALVQNWRHNKRNHHDFKKEADFLKSIKKLKEKIAFMKS